MKAAIWRTAAAVTSLLAVAACGGGDSGTTVGAAQPPLAAAPSPTPSPTPSPSPTPAPAPAPPPPQPDADGPFIDASKIPAAAIGFSTVRIQPDGGVPTPQTDAGQFRMTCDFSHMNFDDPIALPGKPGQAHLHTFFGNTGINASSTQKSIETTGNSTCAGGIANRTGYWIPAVIDTKDGTPLKPLDILVYYKSDPFPGKRTQLFPAGLRMIAGNGSATSPQAERIDWGCLAPDGSEKRYRFIPPDCPVGYTIEATIGFPNCWDGVNLDSADHKSHMSYGAGDTTSPTGVGCTQSHPIQLPTITEKIRYRVTEAGSTARWRLSSDHYSSSLPGGYSIHADWFNGWDPKVQEIWVKNCLQANRDCHGYLLGDGTALF